MNETKIEPTVMKKLRVGQRAFIAWPNIRTYNVMERKHELDKKFEIVEILVCDRKHEDGDKSTVTNRYFIHYKLAFLTKSDSDRLTADWDSFRREWDTPFGWEDPIASTKEGLIALLLDEIKPLADGYTGLLEKIQKLRQ